MAYGIKLKIGAVPYTNALPLIDGLEEKVGVELRFSTPAQLETDIDCDLLDAAMLPVVSLFSRPHLQMFPFCGIASEAEAGSVLFFRKDPAAPIKRVAYDSGSRTSFTLLRILLAAEGITPEWIPMAPNLNKMLQLADSALLIGDEALKVRTDPRKAFDLVARWKKLTQMPFVFAVWAARADHSKRTDLMHLFTDASMQGLSRLTAIANKRSADIGVPPLDILVYLTQNIKYRLGIIHLDAIEEFKRRCAKLPPLPDAAADATPPGVAAKVSGAVRMP